MCGFLLTLNVFSAIPAIFGVVRFRLKSIATNETPFRCFIPKKLCFERFPVFILQQHPPEIFTVDRVRNTLDTNAPLAVIQQEAVTTIIIAADIFD